MPQDKQSGGRAAKWGRETARRLATELGATEMSSTSNECQLHGKRVVIRCAAPKTDRVGVTYRTLERVELVLGAFQVDDSSFELLTLTPAQYRDAMQATASKGPSAGRVGMVTRDYFVKTGQSIGRVTL